MALVMIHSFLARNAELATAEKKKISHRARALAQLKRQLGA